MKKIAIVLLCLIFSGAAIAQTLTKADRKAAVKYLKWTNKELKKSLKGLSSAQLNFKADSESWSANDCLYHIAFSEGALRGALDKGLSEVASAEAKKEIKMTDEQIKKIIEDRSTKVKTQKPFEPENTGFKSNAEAMAAFKAKRKMLLKLVKNQGINLRNHVMTLPFGKIDGYQWALFIGGHTYRHTKQINEIKAAKGYPQS